MITSTVTYPMWFIADGSVWTNIRGYSKMICPAGGRTGQTEESLRTMAQSIHDERMRIGGIEEEEEELARLVGMSDLVEATVRMMVYHRS